MHSKDDIGKLDEFFIVSKKGEIYEQAIGYVEKVLIEKALEYACGNQVVAAKILGLNRNTLHSKIVKLHIMPEKFK